MHWFGFKNLYCHWEQRRRRERHKKTFQAFLQLAACWRKKIEWTSGVNVDADVRLKKTRKCCRISSPLVGVAVEREPGRQLDFFERNVQGSSVQHLYGELGSNEQFGARLRALLQQHSTFGQFHRLLWTYCTLNSAALNPMFLSPSHCVFKKEMHNL